ERTAIETEIKLGQMMREYLAEGNQTHDLVPNNTGLVDTRVESQISEYNTMLLRRNRLVEGSSAANPVVQDLDRALTAMRSNISRALDNALAGLEVKLENVRHEEQVARGRVI